MISCILLAAGESKRFGSPKALAKLKSETVIEHIQKILIVSKVTEIIIVLGAESEKIKLFILKNEKIRFVVNENFQEGQTSSFKIGLKAVSTGTKGVILLPIDMPLIKKATFNNLIDYFLENNPLILIPTYQEKYAHPPIFNMSLWDEIINLDNSAPLYTIQHKYKDSIANFPVKDIGVTLSFNTPAEFQKINL